MRFVLVLAAALLGVCGSATAQISIQVGLPSVRIGVRLGGYPDLVAVPGYPVYYAPQLDSNLFFYDGLYWVYAQDRWYASSWYDGPWDMMEPEAVPYFVLRVPVEYYRQPPPYFRGWERNAPPRWGEHWGHDWEQRHGDWNRWDRRSAPRPAPLPTYQRQYSGNRYPDASQQRALRERNYRYQPHEAVVQQHFSRPAPERIERGNAGDRHSDRPANAGRPEDMRRNPQERSAAPPEANREREQQRQQAQDQQQRQRQQGQEQQQRQQEQQRQRQQPQEQQRQQPPQQHEEQAPRGREQGDRPQTKGPDHEQKKEPERDH